MRALPAADGVVRVTIPDVELLAQRYKGRKGIRRVRLTLGLVALALSLVLRPRATAGAAYPTD